MSKILEDITTNKINLSECLQRLLVISNKLNNNDLSKWCLNELNGYNSKDKLPNYRKFVSRQLEYSGINGDFQVKNSPLQPGFLSEKTLSKIENIFMYENIVDVEKRKDSNIPLYRDMTPLAVEVYRNTSNCFSGVQCLSIRQVITPEFYSKIYMEVKTRIINLLCTLEKEGVNFETFDVKRKKQNLIDNEKIYNHIINGESYTKDNVSKKIFWNIFIPIITGFLSAIISGILVYFITNVWMSK